MQAVGLLRKMGYRSVRHLAGGIEDWVRAGFPVDLQQVSVDLGGTAAAEEPAQRIAEALDPVAETLILAQLGPVVGAHAGPGTVGVGCYPANLFPLGLRRLTSVAAT